MFLIGRANSAIAEAPEPATCTSRPPGCAGFSRDDRERHVYIVGKSGSGESTFLYNLAMGGLIDPQGELKSRRRSGTRGPFWNMLQNAAAKVQQQFQSHPFAHPYYWGGFVYTGL